jgi:hypothetical protein
VAVREQVRRWVQHVSINVWSTALERGTYGGCVVGEDGQGLLRSLHRQVRRLLARRAASPNPDGRLEHTPLHTATRRPLHDGHLGVYLGGSVQLRSCVRREQASFVSANRFVGESLSSCKPPSLRPSWCTKHVATRERSAHVCRWQHRPGLCFALTFSLPSSPTGRPDQLPACTGACASGGMFTVPQGAQLSAAMVLVRLKLSRERRVREAPGLHQPSPAMLGLMMRTLPPSYGSAGKMGWFSYNQVVGSDQGKNGLGGQ